ncbi:YqeG family HAD IIIA-type phosphatase [Lacticigenium naphthae]|uniref:YqeG family HAD IIIA-type phosphatase n=1 Tax=Lacticigenium naphthae TaxID=515351 RepID=UPI00042A5079|nr:YqeG family HAD IIIA-type phosphatase [Lacticigenium naphthae]
MLNSFKPTWMVESIYQISPEQLKKQNVKAVLADLDNTLIAWDNPEGTQATIQWIETMKKNDIEVIILSNNSKKRVGKIARILKLKFVSRGLKPLTRGFTVALNLLPYKKSEIIMVGDQIVTDIRGANAFGIRSALVKPLLDSDAWNTKFNRFIELKIMNYLIKKNPDMKWRNSLHDPIRK